MRIYDGRESRPLDELIDVLTGKGPLWGKSVKDLTKEEKLVFLLEELAIRRTQGSYGGG